MTPVRNASAPTVARIAPLALLLALGCAAGCLTPPPEGGSPDARPAQPGTGSSDGAVTGTGGVTGRGGQTGQAGSDGGNPNGSGGQNANGGNQGSGGTSASGGGGAPTATGGRGGSGGTITTGSGGRGGAAGSGGAPTGSGGRGGAGGVATATGGALGTGGGTTVASCTNNRRDGSETGIDCGGSCPACVNYKINPPNRMNSAQSGCQGGPGFMCVRSMLFSPEFKQAAMDDWGAADPPFVYATVGHDPDTGGIDAGSNTCCQCYQLVFESPVGATGLPIPKPMIVQAFNTAAGGGKKFDVYMAVGGYGANNGCFGGANPMYSGFPDLGGDYVGGVKAGRYSQCAASGRYTDQTIGAPMCQDYVGSQCALIRASASPVNQTTSQASCIESNYVDSHYHINWNVRAKRVECPANLTRVTGCKLNNQGLPAPDPAARTVATADATYRTGYGTTTMQDCCRPTCAWPNNVTNTDPMWSMFYTCDKAGNPATQ